MESPAKFDVKTVKTNKSYEEDNEARRKKKKPKIEQANKHFSNKDHCIRANPKERTRLSHLIHVEKDPNGNATVAHVYSDEIANLSDEKRQKFVKLFFREVFGEQNEGVSNHVMGIVHDAAAYLPELVSHFGNHHSQVPVKMEMLGKKTDIETIKMEDFSDRVKATYSCGTYRAGALLQFSLVGTVQEEAGGYYPEFLDQLERCPFLKETMPWGNLSVFKIQDRSKSNDGPILWVRPGEQLIPTADLSKSPYKKRRLVNISLCFVNPQIYYCRCCCCYYYCYY